MNVYQNIYQIDRSWSDQMLAQIKQIVGPFLLEPATFELDTKEATDLFILKARDMRIAARVRRPGYSEQYPYEFTIRSRRDSGAETELSKIVNGWGDWFFYGHATKSNFIDRWWLIDLHAFRAALIQYDAMDRPFLFVEKRNFDGTSFVAFDVRTFPNRPPILVASSHPLPDGATWIDGGAA